MSLLSHRAGPRFARCVAFLLFAVLLPGLSRPVLAQLDGVLQIHDPIHRFLVRQQTRGLLPEAHLSHRPLTAYEARHLMEQLQPRADAIPAVDRRLLRRYLQIEPFPFPAFLDRTRPLLFRNGRDFASVEGPDYALQLNPLLYLSGGYAFRERINGPFSSFLYWQNTRGLRFSGHVGKRFFFESRVEENQRIPRRPAHDRFTAPRLGRVKYPLADEFTVDEFNGTAYDYVVATGLVGFRSRYFEARAGRDRNLWGVGQTSVQLSNYATVYDQVQLRMSVWRLQYVTLFTKMAYHDALPRLAAGRVEEQVLPRRYGAFHRLSIQLPYRLEASLFEGLVFAPDSTGRRTGYELSYLNPAAFYRAVELDLGSPDNAVIGGGLAWILQPGVRLYTDVLFDEFRIAELRTPSDGWWGNKWSWMIGIHATDLVPSLQLSLRSEYTRTRPFTYSHRDPKNAYVHYGDLLGHPGGPNREEIAFFVEAQPTPRLFGAFHLALARGARNSETENFGSDPLVSYNRCDIDAPVYPCRQRDFGLGLLAGIERYDFLLELHAGYELLPGLFLEAAFQGDYVSDRELGTDWYAAPYLTLRWGLPFQSDRY